MPAPANRSCWALRARRGRTRVIKCAAWRVAHAAENLESSSQIASRTIASIEHQWSQGRELLSDRDVLVIDEAGMIGSRQMERVLARPNGAAPR